MNKVLTTPQKKYNIEHRLKQMPGVYRNNCYALCMRVNVSLRQLQNWINYPMECKSSIPVDTFFKIADFFNCKPEDLRNRIDG